MRKLVRDRIPEIIRKKGREPEISIASFEERVPVLIDKLDEETTEFKEDHSPEELADILEVVFALGEELNTSPDDLLSIAKKKRDERGGFREGFILTMPAEKN